MKTKIIKLAKWIALTAIRVIFGSVILLVQGVGFCIYYGAKKLEEIQNGRNKKVPRNK
jgi:hypothetical protein